MKLANLLIRIAGAGLTLFFVVAIWAWIQWVFIDGGFFTPWSLPSWSFTIPFGLLDVMVFGFFEVAPIGTLGWLAYTSLTLVVAPE